MLPFPWLANPNPVTAARNLLGQELRTTINGETTAVLISETEAYFAPEDRASHAYGNKRTPRTEVFYRAPGTAYVYLCYGIHEMMNVVTGPVGTPHAVLIRAGTPLMGVDVMRRRRGIASANSRKPISVGPGVLTQALGVDRRFNGVDLLDGDGAIQLLPGLGVPPEKVVTVPRVGIGYAGEPWVSKPWRFQWRAD